MKSCVRTICTRGKGERTIRKHTLYDKTQRLGTETYEWTLTEKLDGSNLCFLNYNKTLYVATRNRIMSIEEALRDGKGYLYQGLYGWLEEHAEDLARHLEDEVAIFGEWLGMGKIKYPSDFPKFNMFATACVILFDDERLPVLDDYDYDCDNFHYAFKNNKLPDYIGPVPFIAKLKAPPTVSGMDGIYQCYSESVKRPVEGIVVTQKAIPGRRVKYVRMKNGKMEPHRTAEEMEERMREGLARRDASGRKRVSQA